MGQKLEITNPNRVCACVGGGHTAAALLEPRDGCSAVGESNPMSRRDGKCIFVEYAEVWFFKVLL